MQRKNVRRGCGALLVAAVLGIPGPAAAAPAGPPRDLGPRFLWDLLVEIFLDDEPTTAPSQCEGTGGEINGGGAMDPNGSPKPTPPPPPPQP